MIRLFVVVFVLATIVPTIVKAKKPVEWCLGNGCITGGAPLAGGSSDMLSWHKCRPGEPNVCRKWSVEKPK